MNKLITSKPCRICHVPRPLKEFSRDAGFKSGIKTYCKLCEKGINRRNYQKKKRSKGFSWQDVSKKLTATAEEEFDWLYGGADVEANGKLVMKKGKVIDKEWYRKKLAHIKKHM